MIYTNYADRVKHIVAESRSKHDLSKSLDDTLGRTMPQVVNMISRKQMIHEQRAFSNKLQLSGRPLGSILKNDALTNAKLGVHPDFKHLKGTDEIEYHYIVSVFIDIQGSTQLHSKYGLEDTYRITNTIQSAAIHTCLALGGHVQRLQGDGVFAYFGGKSLTKKRATELAVTAASMFTYFMKTDLKDVFLEDGIENIGTRIGIDFGDDDDVLWANFGLNDVSELTTNSLHTSLAHKMQAYAIKNGIVVGQHVKDRLLIDESMYDLVKNSKGEIERRYIFEYPDRNFRYTQYRFEWLRFLKSLPFIGTDSEGKLFITDEHEQDKAQLAKLRETANLVTSGRAYADREGQIMPDNTGVHHEPHRFHYE